MIALGNGTITVTDVFDIYKKKVLSAFDAIMNSKFVQGIIGFFTNLWNTIKTIGENAKSWRTLNSDYIDHDYSMVLNLTGFGTIKWNFTS